MRGVEWRRGKGDGENGDKVEVEKREREWGNRKRMRWNKVGEDREKNNRKKVHTIE